jgi:hypothetical protein
VSSPILRTEFTNQTAQLYSLGWMCPKFDEPDEKKIAWMQRSVSAGQSYLQSQTAYKDIDTAVAVIANTIKDSLPSKKLSRVMFNRLKRQIKEIISTLTNLNPRWDYETFNETLQLQASILNKRRDYWWQTSFVDRIIKECLQWGILGAGYLHLSWGKTPFGNGPADVIPRAFGVADIIPDQIPRDGDLQRAYAVHIRDTMPLAAACAAFPDAARLGKIIPDRIINNASGGQSPVSRLVSGWAAPIFRYLGLGGNVDTQMSELNNPFPEVDVYYTYVADQSVNESGAEMHTDEFTKQYQQDGQRLGGTQGTMWEYSIPPLNSEVPDGTFTLEMIPVGSDPITGAPIMEPSKTPNMRPVTYEECLLYPLRRLVIWTSTCVLYDGPSPWWHGKVPVVKFTFDKWPWQYLGYNLIGENLSIQQNKTSIDRGIVDMMELRIDPPLAFNEQEYARKAMEELNLRVPGERVPNSGLIADGVKPILPWQQYEPPPAYIPIRQEWNQEFDYLLGVQDFAALAKLNQAPSAESIDRLLQAAGPLTADFARDMERSLTEVGYMFMWLVLEFDTTARRLQILGRDGITKEDFDFKPGSLIPDIVPGLAEDAPLMRKGLLHGRNFAFNITPRSAFNVTDIQNKLFLLQLWRDPKNFPIDPWTLAERWGIPNFGEAPSEATTVVDRWKAWMSLQTQFLAVLQVQQQAIMMQAQQEMLAAMGPEAQVAAGLQGMMAQQQQGGGAGGGEQPTGSRRPQGRPPSGGEMPHIENKFDLEGRGPRSTVAES